MVSLCHHQEISDISMAVHSSHHSLMHSWVTVLWPPRAFWLCCDLCCSGLRVSWLLLYTPPVFSLPSFSLSQIPPFPKFLKILWPLLPFFIQLFYNSYSLNSIIVFTLPGSAILLPTSSTPFSVSFLCTWTAKFQLWSM